MMATPSVNLFSRNIYLGNTSIPTHHPSAKGSIKNRINVCQAGCSTLCCPCPDHLHHQFSACERYIDTPDAVGSVPGALHQAVASWYFIHRLGMRHAGWNKNVAALRFKSSSINLNLFGWHFTMYIAIPVLAVNLAITALGC